MSIGATLRGFVAANALLDNELRRMGKRRQTYTGRLGPLLMVLGIFMFEFIVGLYPGLELTALQISPEGLNNLQVARGCAFFGFVILGVGAFAGAPVLAASAYTQEKNDRILPILLMADLDGWGLIRAKFVTLWLQLLMTELTAAPLLVLGVYLGAVSASETLSLAAVILAGGTLACAIGSSASLYFDRSSLAGGVTIIGLALMYVLIAAILRMALGVAFSVNDLMIWRRPAVSISVALAPILPLLWLARRLLYTRAYGVAGTKRTSARTMRRRRRYGNRRALAALAASCLRGTGFGGGVRVLRWLAYAGVLVTSIIPYLGWLFIIVLVFREIIISMERLRREGVLDDLVLVPHANGPLWLALWIGQLRLAAPFGILTMAGVGWALAQQYHASYAVAALPLIAVHFLAGTAVACYFGTFNVRLGGVGGYLYAAYWTLTCIVPLWLLGREGPESLGFFMMGTPGDITPMNVAWYLGGWRWTCVYIAINVLPTAALCVWAVRAFGNRLRNDAVLTALRAKER